MSRFLAVFACLAAVCLGASPQTLAAGSQEQDLADAVPYVIAVAGDLSGPNATIGTAMQRGVELAVRDTNARGGVAGRPVQIKVFDDRGDTEQAALVANDVGADRSILGVIGHTGNETTRIAGELYRISSTPAITVSARNDDITSDNNWLFRTIYTDGLVGELLAHYARNVLGHTRVAILYTNDWSSAPFVAHFVQSATPIGLDITDRMLYPAPTVEDPLNAEAVVRWAAERALDTDLDAVLLAVSPKQAAIAVRWLREYEFKGNIFGLEGMATSAFREEFAGLTRAQLQPGFYTDGIKVLVPLTLDVANRDAQRLARVHENIYGEPMQWPVAYGYDAAMMLLDAIGRSGALGKPATLHADRGTIRDFLAAINQLEFAVPGVTGPNFFDSRRQCEEGAGDGCVAG